MSRILCSDCNEPILARADLVVIQKGIHAIPLHTECLGIRMREEGWEGDILNGKAGQALKRNSISAMLTVLFLIIAAFIGWHEFTDILIEGVTLLGVVGCGVVIVSVAISELYQLSLIESVKERFESKLLE